MIKVYISKDKIVIMGHANYADYGKDIVCASVSSIVTTSVNLALKFNKEALTYKEEQDKFTININTLDEQVALVMENMLDLLEELAKTYTKNIKIIKEEKLWI